MATLPLPVGRQKDVLYLPAAGHHVVLGTAGSGKTTLAMLRSAYLADPGTDHSGRTLLVTFNRTLVSYLRSLGGALRGVQFENYHKFARGYLASQGLMARNGITGPDDRQRLIAGAISDVAARYPDHPLFQQGVGFFSEELQWIAQHGIDTLEAYVEAERVGRAGARVERQSRGLVFEIYQAYVSRRSQRGWSYDWDDLASAARRTLDADESPRRYRHVIIDEGQDFSPEMIRSLAGAVPEEGSLTFFGDVAQQIYGHRLSWRSAGLSIAKVWEFKENYRNSKQIAKLALAISAMPYFKGVPDLVEPNPPTADAPQPVLVIFENQQEEVDLVVGQAAEASRSQRVAVLLRRRVDEALLKERLPSNSVRLDSNLASWRTDPGVWYGTYHAAKGLEFDTVILPFLSSERMPDPEDVTAFSFEEACARNGKLLYVGVTRAKTRLIMTCTGERTPLLPDSAELFQTLTR